VASWRPAVVGLACSGEGTLSWSGKTTKAAVRGAWKHGDYTVLGAAPHRRSGVYFATPGVTLGLKQFWILEHFRFRILGLEIFKLYFWPD
jgi:hypothetical protein